MGWQSARTIRAGVPDACERLLQDEHAAARSDALNAADDALDWSQRLALDSHGSLHVAR
jgi:hypothetical protein